MNKKELEKKFDERFKDLQTLNTHSSGVDQIFTDKRRELKDYIFNEMILEVLKEIQQTKMAKTRGLRTDNHLFANGYNQAIDVYKQKAKELYDIDL